MKSNVKTLLSYILSFILSSSILHIDHIEHDHHEGYSICDVSCNDGNHHSSSHQCVKCLSTPNELIVPVSADIYFNRVHISTYSLNESTKNTHLTYKLYSRPPPNLL